MAGGESSPAVVLVRLQRAAHHAILEHFQRRTDAAAPRVLGVLTGSVGPAGTPGAFVADVRHAYAVPHSEAGDQIAINGEHFRARIALHRKCHGRDAVLLGWFEVSEGGARSAANDAFVREYFARETGASGAPQAVRISLEVSSDGAVRTAAHVCPALGLGRTGDVRLSDVSLDLAFGAAEMHALGAIVRAWSQGAPESAVVALPSPAEHRAERSAELAAQLALLRRHAAADPEAAALLALVGDGDALSGDAQLLAECRLSLAVAAGAMQRSLSDADRLLLSRRTA